MNDVCTCLSHPNVHCVGVCSENIILLTYLVVVPSQVKLLHLIIIHYFKKKKKNKAKIHPRCPIEYALTIILIVNPSNPGYFIFVLPGEPVAPISGSELIVFITPMTFNDASYRKRTQNKISRQN